MKFDKVKIEHISQAVEDLIEKGIPEGFKASAYFDVDIKDLIISNKSDI